MLSNMALVILTLLLLQGMVAAAWAVAIAVLGVPRRPAWNWCASALLGAASLGTVLLRGEPASPVMQALGNVLMMGFALSMARGLRAFVDVPLRDRAAGMLLAAGALACAAVPWLAPQAASLVQAWSTSLVLVLGFGGAIAQTWSVLRREFGRRAALVLSAPMALLVGVGLLRIAGTLRGPVQPIHMDRPLHLALALMLMLTVLSLHGAMAAMVVMRMVARLRELSERDALTGLENRAAWLRRLLALHRQLDRHPQPFALLVLDIDRFKAVNDEHGHAAGDAVLVQVGQVLHRSLRPLDAPGRLGGEEFGVLLPATDEAAAMRLADRLRAAVARTLVPWPGGSLAVTLSVGVAVLHDSAEPPADALARADAALYAAKRGGRNRVEAARPWVPPTGAGRPMVAAPLPVAPPPAPPPLARRSPDRPLPISAAVAAGGPDGPAPSATLPR